MTTYDTKWHSVLPASRMPSSHAKAVRSRAPAWPRSALTRTGAVGAAQAAGFHQAEGPAGRAATPGDRRDGQEEQGEGSDRADADESGHQRDEAEDPAHVVERDRVACQELRVHTLYCAYSCELDQPHGLGRSAWVKAWRGCIDAKVGPGTRRISGTQAWGSHSG